MSFTESELEAIREHLRSVGFYGLADWPADKLGLLAAAILEAVADAERHVWRAPVLAMQDAVLDTMAGGRPIAHLDSACEELVRMLGPNVRAKRGQTAAQSLDTE